MLGAPGSAETGSTHGDRRRHTHRPESLLCETSSVARLASRAQLPGTGPASKLAPSLHGTLRCPRSICRAHIRRAHEHDGQDVPLRSTCQVVGTNLEAAEVSHVRPCRWKAPCSQVEPFRATDFMSMGRHMRGEHWERVTITAHRGHMSGTVSASYPLLMPSSPLQAARLQQQRHVPESMLCCRRRRLRPGPALPGSVPAQRASCATQTQTLNQSARYASHIVHQSTVDCCNANMQDV